MNERCVCVCVNEFVNAQTKSSRRRKEIDLKFLPLPLSLSHFLSFFLFNIFIPLSSSLSNFDIWQFVETDKRRLLQRHWDAIHAIVIARKTIVFSSLLSSQYGQLTFIHQYIYPLWFSSVSLSLFFAVLTNIVFCLCVCVWMDISVLFLFKRQDVASQKCFFINSFHWFCCFGDSHKDKICTIIKTWREKTQKPFNLSLPSHVLSLPCFDNKSI